MKSLRQYIFEAINPDGEQANKLRQSLEDFIKAKSTDGDDVKYILKKLGGASDFSELIKSEQFVNWINEKNLTRLKRDDKLISSLIAQKLIRVPSSERSELFKEGININEMEYAGNIYDKYCKGEEWKTVAKEISTMKTDGQNGVGDFELLLILLIKDAYKPSKDKKIQNGDVGIGDKELEVKGANARLSGATTGGDKNVKNFDVACGDKIDPKWFGSEKNWTITIKPELICQTIIDLVCAQYNIKDDSKIKLSENIIKKYTEAFKKSNQKALLEFLGMIQLWAYQQQYKFKYFILFDKLGNYFLIRHFDEYVENFELISNNLSFNAIDKGSYSRKSGKVNVIPKR